MMYTQNYSSCNLPFQYCSFSMDRCTSSLQGRLPTPVLKPSSNSVVLVAWITEPATDFLITNENKKKSLLIFTSVYQLHFNLTIVMFAFANTAKLIIVVVVSFHFSLVFLEFFNLIIFRLYHLVNTKSKIQNCYCRIYLG